MTKAERFRQALIEIEMRGHSEGGAMRDIARAALNHAAHPGERALGREAAALVMREVVCELIYRNRVLWDPVHPNRSLGIRKIYPKAITEHAKPSHLLLCPDALKDLAAEILDAMQKDT